MKKLLLYGLSLVSFMGTVLCAVPKQSIIFDHLVHAPETLDYDKLAKAELILSPDRKNCFGSDMITRFYFYESHSGYNKMMEFMDSKGIPVCSPTILAYQLAAVPAKIKNNILGDNSDNDAVMETFVREFLSSHSEFWATIDTTNSLDNSLIIELLKEYKNSLITEINAEVKKQGGKSSFGDTATEDYAVFSLARLMVVAGLQYGLYHHPNPVILLQETGFMQGVLCTISAASLYKLYNCHHYIRSREAKMNTIDALTKTIEKIEAAETA